MIIESLSSERLRHQLNVQSRQINRVFQGHDIPVEVTGGIVRDHSISFDLKKLPPTRMPNISVLKIQLTKALGVRRVTLVESEEHVQIHTTQTEDIPVSLLELLTMAPPLPPLTSPVGLARDGDLVYLRFATRNDGHILIAGDPGSGKTALLRTIAAGLALTNNQPAAQLLIIDPTWFLNPSRSPLLPPLAYLKHKLADPSLDIDSAKMIINFLAQEMVFRKDEKIQYPRLLVFFDHVLFYLENAGTAGGHNLLRLLNHGADFGIHLALATDHPESPLLEPILRYGFTAKFIGRTLDAKAAARVAGQPVDRATLLNGKGDFLVVRNGSQTYFQAAYLNDYDLHFILTEMERSPAPTLLARPFDKQPRMPPLKPINSNFTLRNGIAEFNDATIE